MIFDRLKTPLERLPLQLFPLLPAVDAAEHRQCIDAVRVNCYSPLQQLRCPIEFSVRETGSREIVMSLIKPRIQVQRSLEFSFRFRKPTAQ